jgi:hypothetical protein
MRKYSETFFRKNLCKKTLNFNRHTRASKIFLVSKFRLVHATTISDITVQSAIIVEICFSSIILGSVVAALESGRCLLQFLQEQHSNYTCSSHFKCNKENC